MSHGHIDPEHDLTKAIKDGVAVATFLMVIFLTISRHYFGQ